MNADEEREIGKYLDLAWSQIGNSPCDMDMPDVIDHADTRFLWPEIRPKLVGDILQCNDLPNHVEIVDLPKDELSVRPLARLKIDLRITYEASVFSLTSEIDQLLHSSVFSFRLHSWMGLFRNPIKSWVNMRRYARRLQRKFPNLFLASTDIASFYENIDIDQLARDLKITTGPYWAHNYIEQFLRGFNTDANARGIPQGTNASAVLANLYLVQIDDLLTRNQLRYVRYSDDFYIFGDSFLQLRDALLSITVALRSRNLSISRPKTHIYKPDSFKEWEDDLKKDALAYDTRRATRRIKPLVLRSTRTKIHDEFNGATRDGIDARTLKFCLTQLSQLKDGYAVEWVLANFPQIPHLAKELLHYLRVAFTESCRARMHFHLARILLGDEISAYPYAQQHILIFLMQESSRTQQVVDAAWTLLQDRNSAGFVREMAARYLGRFAPKTGAGNLLQSFRSEADIRVRRALMVACYESEQLSFDALKRSSRDADELIKRTARYLLSSPTDIPLPTSRARMRI